MTRLHFEVGREHNKSRLDDFLFAKITSLSKMYLRELVKNGSCEVNGTLENVGYKLKTNDFIELIADLTRGTAMRSENIGLDIIFEDAEIVVINKPYGMLVHPTHRDKDGTLLNALTFHFNASAPGSIFIRPGLVHRLDKQTSGLMVVAKTTRAHRILADHFKKKLVEKRYVARVEGAVSQDEGLIESSIGRYADEKYWDVKADGKHSVTRFRVVERLADSTLLELEPVTGRTNQLRIHCASIGHAIVGDTRRGGREFKRVCLHAQRLAFRHPTTGEMLRFAAPALDLFSSRPE